MRNRDSNPNLDSNPNRDSHPTATAVANNTPQRDKPFTRLTKAAQVRRTHLEEGTRRAWEATQRLGEWTFGEWVTHLRRAGRWVHYLGGVAIVSAGAAAIIRSGWGAAPYDGLLAAISDVPFAGGVQLAFWQVAWILNGIWIGVHRFVAQRWISGRSLAHSLLFGPAIETFLGVIPAAPGRWTGAVYLAGGVIAVAYGIHTYLRVGVASGILDTTFEAAARRYGQRATTLRTGFDLTVVGGAWLISAASEHGGHVGAGTLIVAAGVGPILALFGGETPIRSLRGLPLTVGRKTLAMVLAGRRRLRIDSGDSRWVDSAGLHISDPLYRSDVRGVQSSSRYTESRSFAHRMTSLR